MLLQRARTEKSKSTHVRPEIGQQSARWEKSSTPTQAVLSTSSSYRNAKVSFIEGLQSFIDSPSHRETVSGTSDRMTETCESQKLILQWHTGTEDKKAIRRRQVLTIDAIQHTCLPTDAGTAKRFNKNREKRPLDIYSAAYIELLKLECQITFLIASPYTSIMKNARTS
jgi:hypothetical protein